MGCHMCSDQKEHFSAADYITLLFPSGITEKWQIVSGLKNPSMVLLRDGWASLEKKFIYSSVLLRWIFLLLWRIMPIYNIRDVINLALSVEAPRMELSNFFLCCEKCLRKLEVVCSLNFISNFWEILIFGGVPISECNLIWRRDKVLTTNSSGPKIRKIS